MARRWWSDARLFSKFAALFVLAWLLTAGLSFVALQQILEPAFAAIEQRVAAEQQARVRHSLEDFTEDRNQVSEDYSNWNDLYEYGFAPSGAFEREMFTPTTSTVSASKCSG